MSLLDRVEQRLGPINTWPTYIIRFLFAENPTRIIVKKLTAFMVGNGVYVNIAADLYLLCNNEFHAHIKDDVYHFNVICRRQMYKTHLYKYYVLKHKYLWLNGKHMDQNEEVLPSITFIEFGIDNTGYGSFIYDRLQYFRHDVKCECKGECE
jgi:hypothetical protein